MNKTDKIREYDDQQEKQGGIVPSKLPPGSIILVETIDFVYELTVIRMAKSKAIRFKVDAGSPGIQSRSESERVMRRIDSHFAPLKHDRKDWIGKDAKMAFGFTESTLLTTEVQSLHIDTGGFKYEFWA